MASSATTPFLPPPSSLSQHLQSSTTTLHAPSHPSHLHHLAVTIQHNLRHQHSWTSLVIHTHSTLTNLPLPLPRPLISGLPPHRAYIHPDEQAEIIKAEHEAGGAIALVPEREWVLPTQVGEKWCLRGFAGVFDALENVPPSMEEGSEGEEREVGWQWRGANRRKRLLLATLHDDSTVVYYIVHDGIVKPRQN